MTEGGGFNGKRLQQSKALQNEGSEEAGKRVLLARQTRTLALRCSSVISSNPKGSDEKNLATSSLGGPRNISSGSTKEKKMIKFQDFIDNQQTDHKWTDISSERYRTYEFAEYEVTIDSPVALSVSKSGGHRVFDASGKSHYIVNGWKHLYWEVELGLPFFVK